MGYDYEIRYKPGREKIFVDALSRVHGNLALEAIFVSQTHLWDDINATSVNNPYMEKTYKLATMNFDQPFSWHHALIYFKDQVIVPSHSSVITQLLKEFNTRPLGPLWSAPNIQKIVATILLALHVPNILTACNYL